MIICTGSGGYSNYVPQSHNHTYTFSHAVAMISE